MHGEQWQDSVDEPPARPAKASVASVLGWTPALLVLYFAIRQIPLPILSPGASEVLRSFGRFEIGSVLCLGIMPFVTGFLLVELFSLLTPWGRRARGDGSRGRRKLNRWALRCSLVVCGVQALGVTLALENLMVPGGGQIVVNPGLFSRLVAVAGITAGSVVAFLLCNLITARGIGNGFCIVFVIEILDGAIGGFDLLQSSTGSAQRAASALVPVVVVAAVFAALLRRRGVYSLAGADDRSMLSRWPALPQSLLPIGLAYWLLELPNALVLLQGQMPQQEVLGPAVYLAGLALAVPVLSYVALHLFSSRPRIERNLPGLTPAGDFSALSRRTFWPTTAAITLVAVGLSAVELTVYAGHFLLGAVEIGLVVALAMDLFDEWRFRRRHPGAGVLAELDNVHLAHLVETHLAEQGIACRIKALHFRSLLFWLGPIYKMNVLVAGDRLDEAREWFEGLDPRIL